MAGRTPGRPKKPTDEVRGSKIAIRLNKDDEELLMALQMKTGMSHSALLRYGLRQLGVIYHVEYD